MKILNELVILPRRDILENWKTMNPILREKELACVLTPKGKIKWKVGDGVTPFNKLRFTNKISDIQEIILYNSILETSTDPKFIATKNTVVYFNPYDYVTRDLPES